MEHEAQLRQFAEFIATAGVERGLVGPREVPRIWERHILNCAVVAELIPAGASVVDVGSGAGLPGVVLAIVRPDLQLHLVEPLLRRVTFLNEAVELLGLSSRVHVHRGRANEVDLRADVVTSRAVAALDVLTQWSLPLVRVGGQMLAMKGSSAAEELASARQAITKAGGDAGEVLHVGMAVLDPPTTVVRIYRVR